jgi:hypothetical protein
LDSLLTKQGNRHIFHGLQNLELGFPNLTYVGPFGLKTVAVAFRMLDDSVYERGQWLTGRATKPSLRRRRASCSTGAAM